MAPSQSGLYTPRDFSVKFPIFEMETRSRTPKPISEPGAGDNGFWWEGNVLMWLTALVPEKSN